jgi:hypothetical protein
MDITSLSDTSFPCFITLEAFFPRGVPAETSARNISPVDNWGIPYVSTILGATVPLPKPGGPRRIIILRGGTMWVTEYRTGILGFTNIIKQNIKAPELFENIQYLEESAQRLEVFSYQALLITELRTKQHKIKPEFISLKELVDITKSHLADKIQAKEISVILKMEQTIDVIKGDSVRITDGPFKGMEGKVTTIDDTRGKIKVLISMFGRETPVELDFLQIKKI